MNKLSKFIIIVLLLALIIVSYNCWDLEVGLNQYKEETNRLFHENFNLTVEIKQLKEEIENIKTNSIN